MKNAGPRFDHDADRAFTRELRAAVNAYFKERGLSPRANREMWVKTAILLTALFGSYGLLLSGALPLWGMWLCCVALGVSIAGYGFAVMHDALHGTYSKDPRVNKALGFVLDLVGASSYLWTMRHNTMHHAYTNVYGADVDLDASWVLRLSPHAARHPAQRYQHIYAYLAYSITTLHWIFFKDYKSLSRRTHGPFREVTHPPAQVALVIGMKLLHYVNFILLPWLLLDVTAGQFFVGWLTMHLTCGFLLTMVFQLSHVVDKTEHFAATPGAQLPHSWTAHELKTTTNFACESRLVTWFVGGLNHQIEHHLFPQICSVHYPALRPIVKEVVTRHGLPYHEHATVADALASHHRLLRRLGPGPEPQAEALCAPQPS